MEKTREAGAEMWAEPCMERMVEMWGTMMEVRPLGGGQEGGDVVDWSILTFQQWSCWYVVSSI